MAKTFEPNPFINAEKGAQLATKIHQSKKTCEIKKPIKTIFTPQTVLIIYFFTRYKFYLTLSSLSWFYNFNTALCFFFFFLNSRHNILVLVMTANTKNRGDFDWELKR